MKRISLLAVLLAMAAGLGGCTIPDEKTATQSGTLPWNRPQSWEGAGMMGAAMQGTP
ncbi:MAG: hypothetical protein ACOYNG_03270 [Terrimicrobiaceae bacterium]